MKKIFFCLMPLLMLLMAAVCTSCKGCTTKGTDETKGIEPVSFYHDYDGVVQDFTAGVAHIQALHRQTMFALNGGEYEWRNSKVTLNDVITAENIDDLHITCVTDVFQLWTDDGPVVQFISSDVHNGTIFPRPIHDLWIEDASLNNAEIKLTAEQALQRLKEVNCPIPAAKSMSLRLPVGPCRCNAQWVVGDVYDVLFIDAVTGEVSNWCPAFNPTKGAKGGDFGKPLGEWP
jgi:hypothetical protein